MPVYVYCGWVRELDDDLCVDEEEISCYVRRVSRQVDWSAGWLAAGCQAGTSFLSEAGLFPLARLNLK